MSMKNPTKNGRIFLGEWIFASSFASKRAKLARYLNAIRLEAGAKVGQRSFAEAINKGKVPLGFVCHIEDVFPAMTAQTVKRVTLEADVGERNVVGRTGFLHFFVVLNFSIELLLASELFFEIVNL